MTVHLQLSLPIYCSNLKVFLWKALYFIPTILSCPIHFIQTIQSKPPPAWDNWNNLRGLCLSLRWPSEIRIHRSRSRGERRTGDGCYDFVYRGVYTVQYSTVQYSTEMPRESRRWSHRDKHLGTKLLSNILTDKMSFMKCKSIITNIEKPFGPNHKTNDSLTNIKYCLAPARLPLST